MIGRRTQQTGRQGISTVILALTASMSTSALAVETVEYRLSVDDLAPIKQAVADILPSTQLEHLTIGIAQARQAADQTVYVCGLISGLGDEDANLLFFAERIEEGYVARAVDLEVHVPGAAKERCDEYGFYTPKPGYTVDYDALPKRVPAPSTCSYLCGPIDPDAL